MSSSYSLRAGICFALLQSACVDLTPIIKRLDNLENRQVFQEDQAKRLRHELADNISLALCTPELRQLIENVKKECMSGAVQYTTEVCSTAQIKPGIISIDPEHKGRFLKIMAHLPHEVIYLGKEGRTIPQPRMERLSRIAKRALLDNTKFLIASSPESGQEEAERRALFIEYQLQEYGIPSSRISRWIL